VHGRRTELLWCAGGLVVPVALALALVPARSWLGTANIALLLVIVVVGAAASGHRAAALVTAVSAALSFDIAHTEPYGSLAIANRQEIITFVCVMAVGVAVVAVATWGRRQRTTAERTISDVAVLRSVAELTSSGEDADYVVITAAWWLRELLGLADRRFEHDLTPTDRAVLSPSGEITMGPIRWDTERDGMPGSEIELVVRGKGRPLARFVLTPVTATVVRPDRLLTAVALADQVGACLAADGRDHQRRD
jgi:hypothetical protein